MRGWWLVMMRLVLYDINAIYCWMTTIFVDSPQDSPSTSVDPILWDYYFLWANFWAVATPVPIVYPILIFSQLMPSHPNAHTLSWTVVKDFDHDQQTSLQHVCWVIFVCQQTCHAKVDSHWGEATQMCTMQQSFQSSWRSEEALADPHWSEASQMCTLQEFFQSSCESEKSPAHSRWSKASQVCTIQHSFQSSWRSEEAHDVSQWREASQVCTVQQIIQSSWWSEDSLSDSHWREIAQMCNKSLNNAGNLRTHLQTHSGEKLHTCAECNKSFWSSWKSEKSSAHSQCNQCSHATTTAQNLTFHIMTHPGEKVFKCTQCNHATTSARNLRNRIR